MKIVAISAGSSDIRNLAFRNTYRLHISICYSVYLNQNTWVRIS